MSAQPRFVAQDDPLWWVQVQGKAYGPYSPTQIQAFLAEGRVKPHTPVSLEPESGWRSAQEAGLTNPGQPTLSSPIGADPDQDARLANMIVWADLPSGGEDHVDTTLEQFGARARIGRDLWVLRTTHPAAVIRAAIADGLAAGERFLVVDANRGRLAWSNLGLDAEASLRRVWDGRG